MQASFYALKKGTTLYCTVLHSNGVTSGECGRSTCNHLGVLLHCWLQRLPDSKILHPKNSCSWRSCESLSRSPAKLHCMARLSSQGALLSGACTC